MDISILVNLGMPSYEESIGERGLPKSREEFEVRANLYYLNFEMKNYLNIEKHVFSIIERGGKAE